MVYKEEKLEQIIHTPDPAFNNVAKCRNETWWTEEVYAKLAQHNTTFCGMIHPSLPYDAVKNTGTVYYRFYRAPDLYRSKYILLKHFKKLQTK